MEDSGLLSLAFSTTILTVPILEFHGLTAVDYMHACSDEEITSQTMGRIEKCYCKDLSPIVI